MRNKQSKLIPVLLNFAIVFGPLLFSESLLIAEEEIESKANQTQLMIMDADGSNLKVLFQSDQYPTLGSPAISPDGGQIAMDGSKEIQGNANNSRILIINSDGTGLKDVVDGAMPTWSSDSKQITFTRERPYGAWKMDSNGANLECIDPAGRGTQWSPDGTMIIYTERSFRETNVKIYNTKDDTFRFVFPLGKNPYAHYFSSFCWSPESQSICFKGRTKQRKLEIVTLKIDSGIKGLKVLISNAKIKSNADFAWHPDGKQILCVLQTPESRTPKIFSLNPLKEGELKMIPGQKNKKIPEDLCWTPDGKKIIFTRR